MHRYRTHTCGELRSAHTGTTKELKATLAKINSIVTPPSALDDRHQGMIDELRGAKDGDFDTRYMSQQVDAHREALILVRGYSKDGVGELERQHHSPCHQTGQKRSYVPF